MMRYVRGWARFVFLVCSWLAATPVQAGADMMATFARLADRSFVWEPLEHVTLAGQPMYWRSFESPKKILVVASQLSQFSGVFQRALVLNGKVMLSGVMGDQHWVADLTATPVGVKGVLSMILLSGSPTRVVASGAPGWLQDYAQQRHQQMSSSGTVQTTQQVYSTAQTSGLVLPAIRQRFVQEGWQLAGNTEETPFEQWQRGEVSVMLLAHQVAAQTTLFVHVVEPVSAGTGG